VTVQAHPTQLPTDDPFLAALPLVLGHRIAPPCALLQKLGEGAAGVVYRAVHLNLELDVAVKFLRPEVARHEDQVSRFLREARIAASIRHENLVSVYDTVARDQTYYTVMELVEGETLHDRVARKGQLPIDEALALVAMALRGLVALHKRGVVHRDVKPTNIIISTAGEVKLSDLGIARASLGQATQATLQTHADALIGTPQYMAPEQFRSANEVEARSDVFSMAGVIWFCLAGDHAIRGDTLAEVMHNICAQPYPPIKLKRSDVPIEIANLIAQAAHPDVKARPTSRELLDRLLSILHARGVASPEAILPDVHAKSSAGPSHGSSMDKTTLRSIQKAASSLALPTSPTIPPTRQESQSGSKGRIIAMAIAGAACVVAGVAYFSWPDPMPKVPIAAAPTTDPSTAVAPATKPGPLVEPGIIQPIASLGLGPTDPLQKQRWQELQTIVEDLESAGADGEKRKKLIGEGLPRAMALAEDLTISSKPIYLAAGRIALEASDTDLAAETLVALKQLPQGVTGDEPTQKLMARLSRLALPGYVLIVDIGRLGKHENEQRFADLLEKQAETDLYQYGMYPEARRVLTVPFHRLKGSQFELENLYREWLNDTTPADLLLNAQKARMRMQRAQVFLRWKVDSESFEPRYDDAIYDLNYAIDEARLGPPERYDALILRGRAYSAKNEHDAAMQDLNAAINAPDIDNERKATALGHRGIVWSNKNVGLGLGAILDYNAALALPDVSEETRKWIETLIALEKLKIPK
jgi:eukaryotic-like serine/threonine-protein kinase